MTQTEPDRILAAILGAGRTTSRIDKVRKLAGMDRHAFDQAIAVLCRERRIELTGGDTSEMSSEEIADLIPNPNGPRFVNIVYHGEPISPARFLVSLRSVILPAYREHRPPEKAYDHLIAGPLPGMGLLLTKESFGHLAEVMALTEAACRTEAEPERPAPNRFVDPAGNNWTVNKSPAGYFRIFRRIRGKLVSVHIGKRWPDSDKINEKIEARTALSETA